MSNQSTTTNPNEEEEEEDAPITRTAPGAGWSSSGTLFPRDASGKLLNGGRSCRRRRRASRRRASRRRASRRRASRRRRM